MSINRPAPDSSSAPDPDAPGAPDPFLFDQEQIDTLGPPELIRAGLFQRFAERIGERADLLIGDDARDHALRLAEDAVRAARAADIGERLRAGGGRLPGIRARLYPHQVKGVAFLAGRGRAL